MASENAQKQRSKRAESASENTQHGRRGSRGRAPAEVPEVFAEVLAGYVGALAAAPLSGQTRRTYASKVRQYLVWLAGADLDGDPLGAPHGRDWAVRDYRGYLQSVLKRSPATISNALAAVDDFYSRRGLGPARARRAELPAAAPRALTGKAQIRYLRAVQACDSSRDRALALVPFTPAPGLPRRWRLTSRTFACRPARGCCGSLARGSGCGGPVHPRLREALADWLRERREWAGVGTAVAVFQPPRSAAELERRPRCDHGDRRASRVG